VEATVVHVTRDSGRNLKSWTTISRLLVEIRAGDLFNIKEEG